MLKGIAESKGEYQSRYDEIAKLYEGIEGANIEEELTADLVGDYLFTDNDFISRLSAEKPGVFKKIFDEIKYLCRVATAGSKEAKELEKVKKTFEELYRESKAEKNTAEGGVRYDLNDNLKNQISDWLAGGGKAYGTYNGKYFTLGTTPNIFVKHGAKSKELIMYDDVITKVTGGKHSISTDEIAKLPAQLNDPILLFKGSVPNSFVALTEIVDKRGNEVIVAVHINKYMERTIVNKIASMYSKTDKFGNNKIIDYVSNQINEGNLLDVSNKKASNWFTARGLQLPKAVQTILDANNSISNSDENVKQNSKKSLSSPKNAVPKEYGSYNVYGEDVMLEGEAKPTGKREFTAPTRESIAEGKKKGITDAPIREDVKKKFPMLDEDDMLPIRRDLKNDLLSRSSKSFGITKPGDYVQVQRQVFDTLEKEGFFSDEGSRSRTITNRDSSMQVEINKKGIKETFNFDNYGKQGIRKKAMKLATVRMLPQIIENGKLIGDNVENYHNDESSNKFAYIKSEVQIDGQDVVVKIDIKKSPQKNKFWVHSIDIKEKVDGLPADTSRVLKRANEHIDYEDSISNTVGNVNSVDNGAEQILGESQLRTAEPKKNNIRDAWKGFDFDKKRTSADAL